MIPAMNYELFMGEALAEARQAGSRGAPAVGAIAVMNEAMVARGLATGWPGATTRPRTPWSMALREAARKLATPHLSDVTIFTTLEPCPMCVGRAARVRRGRARVRRAQPVDGAAGTVLQLAQHPSLGRRLQVVSGIRRAEAEELSGQLDVVPSGA